MIARLAFGFALAAAAACAGAQGFPSRPVKITMPHSSGVAPSIFMRLVAEKLSRAWGRQVVVENRPGASGFIAIEAMKNAARDGHELLAVANSHMTINPSLYKKLPYDPQADFVPVAMTLYAWFFVTVATNGPYQTVPALIAAAKANPGGIIYSSSYVGSPSHLGAAEFEYLTGTRMVHVPYKDQSQMYIGIANGDIHWAFSTIGSALPLIKAGRIKPIAVAAKKRVASAPDVPTVEEAGGPQGFEIDSWIGLVAPSGTPDEVVRKINADVNRVLADAEVLERMKLFGFEPASMTPGEMAAIIRADTVKNAATVRRTGATAE
ncbi:MAG TPA: tripartite tricarboxylate transporter substrate binding protein [Burkholderiales bacterium]|nr:tripartite tricarboxylate transporter substrate binding protein [Burkholderiales bacterium]